MLVGVVALDEAASGLPVAGTFALHDAFATDMASLTTAVFAVPLLMRALPTAVAIIEPEAPDEDELGIVSSVKLLLQRRLLFPWLAGIALCSLHDEILSSFASIRIFADTRETAAVAWNLSALTVGGICGLVLLKLWL